MIVSELNSRLTSYWSTFDCGFLACIHEDGICSKSFRQCIYVSGMQLDYNYCH